MGPEGQAGPTGPAGAPGSRILLTPIASGPICATGGTRIDVGIDTNDNGALDPDEIEQTANVCNGGGGEPASGDGGTPNSGGSPSDGGPSGGGAGGSSGGTGRDAAPDAAVYDPRLILYSPFDSAADVTAPPVGPSGTISGGTFVPGKHGRAFSTSMADVVRFPATIIPAQRGSIEIWAHLIGYAANQVVPTPGAPGLFGPLEPLPAGVSYAVALVGNDGSGGGGLIAYAGHGNTATSCFTTSHTYGELLGDVTAWHHYAVSWDIDGVPGSEFHIQLFFDGKRVSTPLICGENHDPDSFPLPAATDHFGIVNGIVNTVEVDDLKVWSFAKIDFDVR